MVPVLRAGVWAFAVLVLIGASRTAAQSKPVAAERSAALESRRPQESAATATPAVPSRPLAELLSLEPGATCLDRDRLIERVARWLQRTEVDVPLRVHVRGDPELATRVFFAVVREPGDAAERRLDNAPFDCDQLHSAIALSIALAIEATLQQPMHSGALTEEPAKPPAWKRKPTPDPMHLDLAVLGGASIGLLTDAAIVGTPRLGFSPWSWFEIAIVGLGTYLAEDAIEGVPGTFRSTVIAGGLDACFGGETSQGLGFFMCVGGRGGSFQSRGLYDERVADSNPWWGLAASGQGRFWLSEAIGVGTSVEALFALKDRDIVVEGVGSAPTVFKPVSRLGLTVAVGPVFRFF